MASVLQIDLAGADDVDLFSLPSPGLVARHLLHALEKLLLRDLELVRWLQDVFCDY